MAKVRTRKLPRGNPKVWARFVPESGSPHAGSRSETTEHRVRHHESRVRAHPKKKRVQRGKVIIIGKVRVPARPRAALRGKVLIKHDGERYKVKRINRDGTFRLPIRVRHLDHGRNLLTVVYRGSKRPSVAADKKKVVVQRR